MPFSLTGLSVFTPAALWSLLALAIPVLIHLFNRSRGRLVRIGHIDLVRQARKLRVTEVKLAQWLLLLLRLAIFALAALILAGLAQPGLEDSDTASAYVTPAWVRTATPAMLDDLIDAGKQDSRVFVLQPGYARLDKEAADAIRQSPVDDSNISNIWPLLADRLSLEHHGGEVNVYATDYLQQFGMTRPDLPRDVSWNIIQAEVSLTPVNQPSRAVIAYDLERQHEAEIINAALASLKAHRIPALTWQLIEFSRITQEQLNADWLILLSENELTTDQQTAIKPGTTVLLDATGKVSAGKVEHLSLPFYPFSTFRLNGLAPAPGESHSLLATADGRPVLQQSGSKAVRTVQFNSRFNPQWSSVTQQAEFPQILLQLMLSPQQQTQTFADARINTQSMYLATEGDIADIPLPRRSLQSLLAMLLAMLWITERWLSERKKRELR
jgi:hypothetical protein